MTRRAVLALPLLGLFAVDPLPSDYWAIKSLALLCGAILVLAFAAYESIRHRSFRAALSPLSFALALFLLVRGLMLLHGPPPPEAFRWFTLLFALFVVFHVALSTRGAETLGREAVPVYALALGALSVFAIVQALRHEPQAHALFANENFAGAGLAMLLPFALAWKRLRWPLLVLGLGALVATKSRGGALAAAAALALWFVWKRPKLRIPVLLGLPALVVALGIAFGEKNTVKVRFAWYRAAAHFGLKHPIAGLGAGGFEREYPTVRPLEEHQISGGRVVNAVHDDYLESFADGGFPGLLAHLLLVFFAARAARKSRVAACSLLAFATASLVDFPMHDPSLLALAFLDLEIAARPARVFSGKLVALPAAAGAVGLLWALPGHLDHWRAERALHRGNVVAALALQPDHPAALLLRHKREDISRLLTYRPHLANALFYRGRWIELDRGKQVAIAFYRAALRDDDPHSVLLRSRLAELVMGDDPLEAISLLEGAITADPRPSLPYLDLAEIYARLGKDAQAERMLDAAAARTSDLSVPRLRLRIALAHLDAGKWDRSAVLRAVGALPENEVLAQAKRALHRAEQSVAKLRPPHPLPKQGESAVDYAKRLQALKEAQREKIAPRLRPDYLEALVLCDALLVRRSSSEALHLAAAAKRGLGDFAAFRKYESAALLLDGLAKLQSADDDAAARLLRKAFDLYPDLRDQKDAKQAIQAFLAQHPGILDHAPATRRLLHR